uniref:acetyl-CoA carboxylase carboxyltransferase beta subunit n=1 Tax=Vicia tibetica TaxID=483877 RepID=UPI002A805659|nr:acetyl-CoA carboxylase carboxyltransferase beta subunit [Vicia tibetica]WNM89958.1 acetyl-CoA carboxylase carboxyltransferase beta subunit [Vicia tibetica]
MRFNRGLEYRCGLSQSIDTLGENNGENEDPSIFTDMDNNIQSSTNNSENSSYSHDYFLVDDNNIQSCLSEKTLFVSDSDRNSYSISYDIEKQIFEIEVEIEFPNYRLKRMKDSIHNSIQDSIMEEIMEDSIEWYVRSQIGNDTTESDLTQFEKDDDTTESDLTQIENSNDTTESDLTQFEKDDDTTESDLTQIENSNDTTESDLTQFEKDDDTTESDLTQIENYYYYYYDDTTESDLTQFENDDDTNESKFVPKERPFVPIDYSDPNCMEKLKHLWVQCESCDLLNYRKHCKSTMFICEHCGDHMKMGSSDRIEFLIDPGTWNPMDEDMVFVAPIGFHSEDEPSTEDEPSEEDEASRKDEPSTEDEASRKDEPSTEPSTEDKPSTEDEPSTEDQRYPKDEPSEEDERYPYEEDEPYEDVEPYEDYLNSYQDRTGLLDAVQTGTGKLDGVPVAIGIMDFNFIGGSMGCVVGEKITRLIEYATNQRLPLIIVCASGGARMQEGSLSLIQMAKISCALYNYQINQKLFYIAILASPTTGGVTASFGMLGDIVITEPNAYIAFAGKRVIEELLKIEVPEGVQSAEFLFEKGAFDSIVPRPFLKEFLSDLFKFHGFFPLTENEN